MKRACQPLLRRGLNPAYTRKLSAQAAKPHVQVTTLPNGIRVATENTPAHFSAVGLYIDAGARYETPSTRGVTHFIDRTSFKTTTTRSADEVAKDVNSIGGNIFCASARESISYESSNVEQATPLAVSIIADAALKPAFLNEELEHQRDAARYEVRELFSKPELFLSELVHDTAYSSKTLGNSLFCPEQRIDVVDQHAIRSYMEELYRPERMVIAGVGAHHDALVELVDKHFSSIKPSSPHLNQPTTLPPRHAAPTQPTPPHLLPSSSPSLFSRAASYLYPQPSLSPSPHSPLLSENNPNRAIYTGGHLFLPNEESEFDHLHLAFGGPGVHNDDMYALAVMQVLLGGGGSFSAGGPGKGMYSRLYTQILNHYAPIDHCASFHHVYTDSSLFGLFASFMPARTAPRLGYTAAQILPHLVHQLSALLYTPIPEHELVRAKNQLKSGMMMTLEHRGIQAEDLGRQVLVHGRKIPIQEMCDHVDAVTPENLRQAAQRWFGPSSGNPATIVCMGREDVGDYRAVLKKYGVSSA